MTTRRGIHLCAPAPIITSATREQGTSPREGNLSEADFVTPRRDVPLAQQIDDLNFYLRKLTLGRNGDISQIDTFEGGSDYEMFLETVYSTGIRYGWTEEEMLHTIVVKLKGKAREYYGALLPVERPSSMEEMKKWFRRIFEKRLSINAGTRELERCIRAADEPLGEFAQRLRVIVRKMFPVHAVMAPEKLCHRNLMLVNQFIEGLDRRLANEILRIGEFYNLEDCVDVAEKCEEMIGRLLPETRYGNIRRVEVPTEDRRVQETIEELDQQFYQEHRTSCQKGDKRESSNWNRAFLTKFPYMKNRCKQCGQKGHTTKGCVQQQVFFCFHCGKADGTCKFTSENP